MKNETEIGFIPHLEDGGYYFMEPIEVEQVTETGIVLAYVEHQSKHLRQTGPEEGFILAFRDNPLGLEIGDKILPKSPCTKPLDAPKEFYVKKVDDGWEVASEVEWDREPVKRLDDQTYIKENVKKVWPVHHSEIVGKF